MITSLRRGALLALPSMCDRREYPAGFFRWLETLAGYSVWTDFEEKAFAMAKVRPRYSAKAIIEVIRWETMIQDGTEFKVNNNWAPGLARLWMFNYGHQYPGFFQLRDSIGHRSMPVGPHDRSGLG